MLAFLTVLFLATPAWAQCEGTWDNERVSRNLDDVATALAQADLASAKGTLSEIDKGFACLEDVVEKATLGRFARSIGLIRFYEQDEPAAIKWGLMAKMVDPEGEWPGELPDGHPYLDMLSEEEDPPMGRAEGWLVPPEKGFIFINGQFLSEPEAYAEIPGLVQLFDKACFPIETFWQDGAAFREGLTSDVGGPIEAPKCYNAATGELRVAKEAAKVKTEKIKVEKAPIDFPFVPVATAGGLAIVSAVSYAAAAGAAGGMNTATDEASLTRARSTTNALVLVSAATGAGAVGIGLGTALAGGGNTVVWSVRF